MLFRYLVRKFSYMSNNIKKKNKNMESDLEMGQPKEPQEIDIDKNLDTNIANVKKTLSQCQDLRLHEFRFGAKNSFAGALFYIDGLVNLSLITDTIIRPLIEWQGGEISHGKEKEIKKVKTDNVIEMISHEVLFSADIQLMQSLTELIGNVLAGDTALIIDGVAKGLIIGSKGWDKRAISEPQSETVVRGPREGFIENLRTNTTLIRRKIRSENLRVEQLSVGRKTRTKVELLYLDGVADPSVLKKVKQRIKKIEVDSILESGYIEEYIEDHPFSPFATIGYTEKPDVAAAKILEGRIAIVIDGTPFVLTVPYLFIESFQTSEDYYNRALYASIMRILRILGYFLTIFTPAVYVSLITFHQELIPTKLLFSIAQAREGTPFPAFVEALIMIVAFEFLRESGVRLPRPVGQAVSIVGALIMGEAAVSAGIIGAPMVIVIAFTAVVGFMVPTQADSASILRLLMLFFAIFLGFYGVALGFLGILIHLATLNSFGIPFFDSFNHSNDMLDVTIRAPLWSNVKRPSDIARGDVTRGRFFIPPEEHEEKKQNEGED